MGWGDIYYVFCSFLKIPHIGGNVVKHIILGTCYWKTVINPQTNWPVTRLSVVIRMTMHGPK